LPVATLLYLLPCVCLHCVAVENRCCRCCTAGYTVNVALPGFVTAPLPIITVCYRYCLFDATLPFIRYLPTHPRSLPLYRHRSTLRSCLLLPFPVLPFSHHRYAFTFGPPYTATLTTFTFVTRTFTLHIVPLVTAAFWPPVLTTFVCALCARVLFTTCARALLRCTVSANAHPFCYVPPFVLLPVLRTLFLHRSDLPFYDYYHVAALRCAATHAHVAVYYAVPRCTYLLYGYVLFTDYRFARVTPARYHVLPSGFRVAVHGYVPRYVHVRRC